MERLSDRFLAVADEHAAATAPVLGSRRISYGELKDQVLRTGRVIGADGDPAPLALHATKTPGIAAVMLACLATGVPYVPIDPAAPAARRAAILRDSGAKGIAFDDGAVVGPPALPDGYALPRTGDRLHPRLCDPHIVVGLQRQRAMQ